MQSVGGELYILLFRSFTSGYHRQEVLGSLVAHTGARAAAACSISFDVLCLHSSVKRAGAPFVVLAYCIIVFGG